MHIPGSVRKVLRTPDGTPVLLPDGRPAFEGGTAVGLINSMRDFRDVEEAWLVLGGWSRNPRTGEVSHDASLDGVFTYVAGEEVNSGVDADFAAVWARAPAREKAAAAEAVRQALAARKGMLVEGITAAGETTRGILREVRAATPVGAGRAAVEVLLEDDAGQPVPATVTEPFRSLPRTAPTPQ